MTEEGVENKVRKSWKVRLRVSPWVCYGHFGVEGSLSPQGVSIPSATQHCKIRRCSMLLWPLRRLPQTFANTRYRSHCLLCRKWMKKPWIPSLRASPQFCRWWGSTTGFWPDQGHGQIGDFWRLNQRRGKSGSRIINLIYCSSLGKSQCVLELNNFITFMPEDINRPFF